MNIECTIEQYGPAEWSENDGTRRYSEWGQDPYFQAVGGSVRIDPPVSHGGEPPYTHFRLYPVDDIRDFESDLCMLAVFDIYTPVTKVSRYPRVEIIGHVSEMAASATIGADDDELGNRYAPAKDRAWKPSLIRVTLRPAETP